MIGAMMGYYNPGNGVTVNFHADRILLPQYRRLRRQPRAGIQTGVTPPLFNGYWLNLAEIGIDWLLGDGRHPGQFGIGLWRQTGETLLPGRHGKWHRRLLSVRFAAHRPRRQSSAHRTRPSLVFYQLGANDSVTLPISQYYGVGATAFGLIPSRPQDSMGFGVSLSRMNQRQFQRPSEFMVQAYYQAHLFASTFLQPTVTYIPTPALAPDLPGALTTTLRVTVLFWPRTR